MRLIKSSVYLGLTIILCVGIMPSKATTVEEGSDSAIFGNELTTGFQFERPPSQPAFRKADRHLAFIKGPELENLRPDFSDEKLFREEAMNKPAGFSPFNNRFLLHGTDSTSLTSGFDGNRIDYSMQRGFLHQQSTDEDRSLDLRGWYTVGVVSAFLITGALIVILSGDDGTPSIPEPPGRP